MFGHARRRSVGLPSSNQEDPFSSNNNKSYTSGATGAGAYPGSSAAQQLKDAWMAQSPRSRLLKTGGILAFVVFVFFFLSGRQSTYVPHSSPAVAPGSAPGSQACTKSYDSKKPLRQYVLMIDAGSTGSRIHVYRFNNCGPTPELENEVFSMTATREGGAGLSAYANDPEAAAKSLDPLMKTALDAVPQEYRSCSPVAVKATAGLRIAGPEAATKILAAVRKHLETAYPFPVVSAEKDGVVIMDGKDEGVYAWITTNYLLGRIGGPNQTPTAAVFDLGGGSTQIVFHPTYPKSPNGGMPEQLAEGDHKYVLNFGGRKFDLYQHSHLGYGLMEARKTMHKSIVQTYLETNPTASKDGQLKMENPCFPANMTKEIKVELQKGEEMSVQFSGPAHGQAAQCRAIAEKMLEKEAECKLAPCSFKGVHQPSLDKTFAREDVYIFSYFYDRTAVLGMPESFTLRELRDLTAQVCQGREAWGSFETVQGALAELEGRPEYCMDLNFMMALLHTGYEMPVDREVRIAKKIKGNEVGWCLGASLPLLNQESGWKCRVDKVA